MDDGGQMTMGAVSEIRAAAVVSMPQGMLAGLMRRDGESWGNLLLRLAPGSVLRLVISSLTRSGRTSKRSSKPGMR
jgi:hypothetical protein